MGPERMNVWDIIDEMKSSNFSKKGANVIGFSFSG
jgi:hypothetical protein